MISLAAPFITSCPSTNPPLPVTPFPTFTLPAKVTPGATVPITFKTSSTKPLFVAFYTGLTQEFAPIKNGNQVTIPADLRGQVYAVITTSGTAATEANTIAGPVILQFEFGSNGQLIAPK